MPRLDGWSLNERIDVLIERFERIENLLAALARKTYGLEDVVEEMNKQLTKEKSNAKQKSVSKDKRSKKKS